MPAPIDTSGVSETDSQAAPAVTSLRSTDLTALRTLSANRMPRGQVRFHIQRATPEATPAAVTHSAIACQSAAITRSAPLRFVAFMAAYRAASPLTRGGRSALHAFAERGLSVLELLDPGGQDARAHPGGAGRGTARRTRPAFPSPPCTRRTR
jgi:hypothetical protein